MKNFFIPNAANNYSPILLKQKMLFVYLIILIIINLVLGDLFFVRAKASVDFYSLYSLHNEERKKRGLQELIVNTDLNTSATRKAEAMLTADCWSHYCPNGKSPWDFFNEVGYTYIYAGENLAEGFDDNEDVMNAWLNSPTHRDNILNPNFDEIGIGFAYGDFQGIDNNTIIVIHFGSREFNFNNTPQSLDTTDLNLINITSPKEGTYLSNAQFSISGTAPKDSDVAVKANSQELGRVAAEGSNFTFRPPLPLMDGRYSLNAQAFDKTGSLLGTSAPVNVEIDTQRPIINTDSLSVNTLSLSTNKLTFKVNVSETLQNLITNLSVYQSQKIDQTNWEIEINRSELEKFTNLQLTALDLAGNSAQYEIPTATILSQALEIEQQLLAVNGDDTFLGNLQGSLQNLLPRDTKTQLNLIFIVFLSILFAIDFYVLSKTGLTGIMRSKSNFHLPIFILLIIIVVIGSTAGNILTGSNT